MPVCIAIVLREHKIPSAHKIRHKSRWYNFSAASRDCSRRLPSAFWKIIIRGRGANEIKRCIECSSFGFSYSSMERPYEKLKHLLHSRKYVLFVCNKIVKWHVHTKSLNMFYIFRLSSLLLRNSFPPFEKLLYKHAIECGVGGGEVQLIDF